MSHTAAGDRAGIHHIYKEVPVIPMMISTSFVDLSRLNFGVAVICF